MGIHDDIARLAAENRAFVIATVIDTAGSVPGKRNFKAAIDATGLVAGTVGGGKIELEVIEEARAALAARKNLVKTYRLSSGPENLGMLCGGSATIVFEYVGPRECAFVFGGGHVAQALVPLLSSVGFRTTVVDSRPEFTARDVHPTADELVAAPFGEYIATAPIDGGSYVVVLSPSHAFDLEILRALFRRDVRPHFLGVIASKRKALAIREALGAEFPGDPRLADLRMPLGLDIGGETHREIALAVAAQLQAVKFGKA